MNYLIHLKQHTSLETVEALCNYAYLRINKRYHLFDVNNDFKFHFDILDYKTFDIDVECIYDFLNCIIEFNHLHPFVYFNFSMTHVNSGIMIEVKDEKTKLQPTIS